MLGKAGLKLGQDVGKSLQYLLKVLCINIDRLVIIWIASLSTYSLAPFCVWMELATRIKLRSPPKAMQWKLLRLV